MNTSMRPPGPFGVALLRNRDLGNMGHSGWGEDWHRVSLVHSTHLQLSHPLRDAGQWAPRMGGPTSEPLSGLGSHCSAGKRWKEEENSIARDGKGKNRFGASFSRPISSTPTAMVSAAQPNTEDSHGKSGATTPAVPGVSIPKVSEAGSSCDVS